MQTFVKVLTDHGIRPSLQRLQIYDFLYRNKIHPTVDTIYLALAKNIPTLSKTTVYNTLKLFLQHSLINSLTIEDEELRYDAELKDHAHFKCTKCGKLFDIFSADYPHSIQLPQDFSLTKKEFCMWGTCSDCKE
ncbi:MAG: Fur family transcriptional regulator [Treponemataceae bacterium]